MGQSAHSDIWLRLKDQLADPMLAEYVSGLPIRTESLTN